MQIVHSSSAKCFSFVTKSPPSKRPLDPSDAYDDHHTCADQQGNRPCFYNPLFVANGCQRSKPPATIRLAPCCPGFGPWKPPPAATFIAAQGSKPPATIRACPVLPRFWPLEAADSNNLYRGAGDKTASNNSGLPRVA